MGDRNFHILRYQKDHVQEKEKETPKEPVRDEEKSKKPEKKGDEHGR